MKVYTENINIPKDFINEKNLFKRAGIIPFLIDRRGEEYILLGKDRKSRKWSDLGGRNEGYETGIENALREYGEESRDVLPLDLSKTSKVLISYVRPNDLQMIMLVRLDASVENVDINSKFVRTKPKTKYHDEMSELKWIQLDEFLEIKNKDLSKSMKATRKLLDNF